MFTTIQSALFLLMFRFAFGGAIGTGGAYVPVKSMPSGIRQFSETQPLTPMVNAVCGLATGARGQELLEHSTNYYIGLSLAWAAAIFVVFGLLAVLRFARR